MITVVASGFAFVLHFMLGEVVNAHHALVTVMVPTLLANLVLAYPVHRLVRSAVHERETAEPAQEVEVLV